MGNKAPYRTVSNKAGHPLAPPSGVIKRSRFVLFEEIGPGPHPCHWCGTLLKWEVGVSDGICVDHLNGDTLQDTPENLVPSCRSCNANRRGTQLPVRTAKCQACGESFTKRRTTSRFCSISCAGKLRPKGPRSEHGTRSRYVYGCRCVPCCAAHSSYMKEYEKVRSPRPTRTR